MKFERMNLPLAAAIAVATCFVPSVQAHFAWLATDQDGHAIYFFGESIAERTYHLPEKLAEAQIARIHGEGDEQKSENLSLKTVDSDALIGRRSPSPITGPGTLLAVQPYGLYHGSLLIYHTQHLTGEPGKWNGQPLQDVALQAVLKMHDDKLVARILHQGKPLAGAKVQLFCDDGHEEGVAETNEAGEVEFSGSQVEDGLNGLLVGHVDEQAQGDYQGEPYQGEANYLTITFYK